MADNNVPKPDFVSDEDWKLLMETRNAKAIRAWGAEHTRRYLESNGSDESGSMVGQAVILITTIGRKTGQERTNPVNFVQDGDKIYVVGSLSGLDEEPFWARNLEQTPRGWVQMKDRRWAVNSRRITDEKERAELWPRLTAKFPLWGHFQKYSERQFKVFELTPA